MSACMFKAPALSYESVNVRFNGKTVLNEFDLTLARGEKVGVVGPSGCGKTTLVRLALGFERPESGSVIIDGEPLNERTVWSLRRKLGWVAQEPDLGRGTAREALERPFHFRANSSSGDPFARAKELFEALLLPVSLLDEQMTNLSGGEKQRVAIVSTLLLDRPILLFDEATSALDANSKRAALELLSGLKDKAILLIAHDHVALEMCDQTVNLKIKDCRIEI